MKGAERAPKQWVTEMTCEVHRINYRCEQLQDLDLVDYGWHKLDIPSSRILSPVPSDLTPRDRQKDGR